MINKLKYILLSILISTSLFGKTNIDDIDLDKFLNELQPKATVMLCKDQANTLDNYISCLETNAKDNPTIENINFLAKIYATYQMYNKAIQTYAINVKKGDKEATYFLAGIYNEALKQHDKAKPYFEKIKDYKDSTCQIGGIVSITKDETPFNFINEYLAKKRTFKYYDNEIKNGNIKAYGCKGLYHNKFEEYKEAEKVFLEGLEKGDLQNLFYLGNFYTFDYKYDNKKSLAYYERSYNETHNEQAAFNLGINYETYNHRKAIQWYMLSAKAGDLKAFSQLGNIYRIRKYKEKALNIYKKAGMLGSWYGNEAVWVFYAKNKRFDEGIAYLKECTAKGYKECARFVGRIYEDHLKDYDKAIKWYKIGYTMGDSRSAFNLGYYYSKVLKDHKKATIWYENAANWGDDQAAYNLANVYNRELKDKQQAIKWYKKSLDMGIEKAKAKLEKLGAL